MLAKFSRGFEWSGFDSASEGNTAAAAPTWGECWPNFSREFRAPEHYFGGTNFGSNIFDFDGTFIYDIHRTRIYIIELNDATADAVRCSRCSTGQQNAGRGYTDETHSTGDRSTIDRFVTT